MSRSRSFKTGSATEHPRSPIKRALSEVDLRGDADRLAASRSGDVSQGHQQPRSGSHETITDSNESLTNNRVGQDGGPCSNESNINEKNNDEKSGDGVEGKSGPKRGKK